MFFKMYLYTKERQLALLFGEPWKVCGCRYCNWASSRCRCRCAVCM